MIKRHTCVQSLQLFPACPLAGAVEGMPHEEDAEPAVFCNDMCLCSDLATGEVVNWYKERAGK